MPPKTGPESWPYGCRLRHALSFLASRAAEVAWVVAMYLVCELLIWGVYSALRPVRVEFLSSIVGMVVVFMGVTVLGWIFPRTESLYGRYVRSKVDFINQNLGIGFPVPMIMFTDKENFGDVGTIFGNFFGTGAVFWTSIPLISWLVMCAVLRTSAGRDQNKADDESRPTESEEAKPPSFIGISGPLPIHYGRVWPATETSTLAGTPPDSAVVSTATSITAVDLEPPAPGPTTPAGPSHPLRTWYSVLLAAACVILVGMPASHAAGEDRPLDFCVLWLAWAASVKAQATLRRTAVRGLHPGVRSVLATSLNPVLLTTFSMAAYTRIKARAHGIPVEVVLRTFSSGTSLAQLWSGTAGASAGFGAGDAALSLLEVGIVVWGFKLYECRRQLASPAGVGVVLVSVLSAGLSSFVSVAMGRAMGVAARECLSFAARSATLALAKPSTAALGGSEMVNACLVVGNGIAGQLIAPWLLAWLRVRDVGDGEGGGCVEGEEEGEGRRAEMDSAVEVAAGAAIGMNGAAMGVSYLYERQSRAAPYAALSMTAFGVVTTVLASVGPFQDALRSVAGA